ncbi:hypothetical protein B0I31_10738 [Saccharothrix carnea]|uniref:Uncharacterized protein n=1 Tax=Saccharothrix carnea TaxID=1280637 RepID=A0A2P8I688_SACCR|nr:hypothetical protein [Saccharothrix carnea]PSL53984.1 hypothetical protein B0I31_10738 [Saccharothrix carnea]
MRKIGWGVGAVAVVVAGAFAVTLLGGEPKSAGPGVCAHLERAEQGAAYRALDCRSPHANVRVAKVVEEASQCPKGGAPYTVFTGTDTLCLMPNFVEGACYENDKASGVRKADCTAAKAVRVVSIDREPVECPNGQRVTYVEPVVTFCLVRVSDLP